MITEAKVRPNLNTASITKTLRSLLTKSPSRTSRTSTILTQDYRGEHGTADPIEIRAKRRCIVASHSPNLLRFGTFFLPLVQLVQVSSVRPAVTSAPQTLDAQKNTHILTDVDVDVDVDILAGESNTFHQATDAPRIADCS